MESKPMLARDYGAKTTGEDNIVNPFVDRWQFPPCRGQRGRSPQSYSDRRTEYARRLNASFKIIPRRARSSREKVAKPETIEMTREMVATPRDASAVFRPVYVEDLGAFASARDAALAMKAEGVEPNQITSAAKRGHRVRGRKVCWVVLVDGSDEE